jgi:hypothetical protein
MDRSGLIVGPFSRSDGSVTELPGAVDRRQRSWRRIAGEIVRVPADER